MRYLNLTSKDVGPCRSREALVRIECVMLYPTNEDERRRAEHAGLARVQLDEEVARPTDNDAAFLRRDDVLERYKFFASAVPIEEIQAKAQSHFAHGVSAAIRLINYVAYAASGANSTLRDQKKEIRKKLSGTLLFKSLSDASLEGGWSKYRPVAHLWAAYVQLGIICCDSQIPSEFPCHLDDLPLFLGLAESFRQEGEACRLKGYAGTLLVAGASWEVPPGIDLPLVDLGLQYPQSQAR
jgi:hypothetical protein